MKLPALVGCVALRARVYIGSVGSGSQLSNTFTLDSTIIIYTSVPDKPAHVVMPCHAYVIDTQMGDW